MPGDLYSADHVWLRVEDGDGRVGISGFAREELGEIAFVELPKPGTTVRAGESVGVIDSLKSTSELYAPVSGSVVEVNPLVAGEKGASLVNEDPTGKGWLFLLALSDPGELASLMTEERYLAHVAPGDGTSPGDPRSR
jgi:glycine cleavage system H protein